MIDADELPTSWKVLRLSDPSVALLNPKKSEVRNVADATDVTFVPMSAVDDGNGIITSPDSRKLAAVRKGYTYFAEGDVLFAKITPCMENGKCAIAHGLRNRIGFGSTEFHVVRAGEKLLPEWLHLILRSQQVRHDAENAMRGAAGQQRVPVDFLEQLEIPVPPLAEQQRLVARIEALASRLEEARRARQTALAEAEKMIFSATQSTFAPDATEDWDELPFAEATKRVQPRAGKLKTAEYRDKGALPIVDQGQALICGYTDDVARKFQGPLPVIVFGDHTRIVKFVDFDFAVGADGTVILHTCERIESSFFYHWLRSIELHNLGYSRHFKLLAETTVRFPGDLAEQRRIVERLDALAAKQTELRRLQKETEAELAAFTPALLAKAFRGEL